MAKRRQKQGKDGAAKEPTPPVAGSEKQVVFEYRAEPGVEIYVVGSFNDWNPKQTRLGDESGDGCYRASVALAPGRHEYKFVVNGQWSVDPKCQDPIVNRYGTLNGVVTVN